MTSPLRSVNVDHVNRLMEAVRIGADSLPTISNSESGA